MVPDPVGSRRCNSGIAKPSVLPVPVLAWPMTSLPESATGSVSSWIGKAVVMPAPSRAVTIDALTPSSAKVWGVPVR